MGSFKVNLKNKKDNKLGDVGMIPKEKRKYNISNHIFHKFVNAFFWNLLSEDVKLEYKVTI